MSNERSYSVKEYAAIILGPGPDGTAETVESHKIRWLEKRLRGEVKPALPAYKAGRKWRASQQDVDTAIELLHPNRMALPQIPQASSMTRTSRRRIAS